MFWQVEVGLKVLTNGKGGKCEWYQSIGLKYSKFPPILNFFKGPRPCKKQKRFRAAKQQGILAGLAS